MDRYCKESSRQEFIVPEQKLRFAKINPTAKTLNFFFWQKIERLFVGVSDGLNILQDGNKVVSWQNLGSRFFSSDFCSTISGFGI